MINYSLPKNLKPYSYEITIATEFDSSTEPNNFDGVVKILFVCNQKTNHIVLHHGYMDIATNPPIVVKNIFDGSLINVSASTYDEETEIFDISVSTSLQVGQNYSVLIHYTGYFESNNFGFYKSFYTDAQGNKKWLVSSQMESTAARSAFPSFDEPGMKATFKLTVIHNSKLTAMSNMPGTRST